MTRKFCCCLPTRLGVLLLSPLTLCLATVCAVISLYGLIRYFESLDVSQRVFLGILGAEMVLIVLASALGFVGALLAHHRLVAFYASSLYTLFFSALVFGAINFGLTWHFREDFIRKCRADNPDMSRHDCKRTYDWGYGLTIAFWAASLLFALYLINIVRQYAKQLLDDRYRQAASMAQYHGV